MKVIGLIKPDETKETEAEGDDYPAACEQLFASISEGYTLLHLRRAD